MRSRGDPGQRRSQGRQALSRPSRQGRTHVRYRAAVLGDISTPEAVERERRSVTMLPRAHPTYDREEALRILDTLASAMAAKPSGKHRRR